ncbi:MAG: Rrf2 family transcriptional regulator [Candidatus Omnitrophica bacterium]|nr:Rrf2 family transcriptional regulator [Candidatus Omnitrophota bacterium]
MRFSKKSEYALKALIELAINHGKGINITLIHDISEREDIPPRYLEQILLNLKNSGILASKRGVGGGYTLDKEPANISLGDIIRVVDGPLSPLGYSKKRGQIKDTNEASYVVREVMEEIGSAIKDIADNISLQDMAKKVLDRAERERNIPNYVI